MLGGVGDRLGRQEVGGRLHLAWESPRGDFRDLDRYRRAAGERAQRGSEALVAEDRRMKAARERANVLERALHLRVRFTQEGFHLAAAVARTVANELEREPGCKQALL